MVDKNTITTVLKRFLSATRQPNYLNLPKYKDKEEYLESNMEIYMSSCWFKSHWSFVKSKAYTINLLGRREGYFVCALPYQIAIKENLLKRSDVEDEMSEADFDETIFEMEMGCVPFGDTEGAFFSFGDISQCRNLRNPLYESNLMLNLKSQKIPDLVLNERRILSLDVALMASEKHNNDASSVMINGAIPKNKSYQANILYLKNFEGLNTDDLALKVRRLYHYYKCTDLVIDTHGVGLGVYDKLIQDIIDPETGELYPALSCCNSDIMAERCKVNNAPKVIWSIKATPEFNNNICILLRSGFQKKKINLLVSELEADGVLEEKIRGYNKLQPYQQMEYKLPFIQTTLLVYELINLKYEVKGTNIKIIEKAGMRKDRYSSLAYNYWVMCELERQLLHEDKKDTSMSDYAKQFRRINKKPRFY